MVSGLKSRNTGNTGNTEGCWRGGEAAGAGRPALQQRNGMAADTTVSAVCY